MDIDIIHLSDLHFRESSNYDNSRVLKSLIKDIENQKKKDIINPSLILISGDITYSAQNEEYDCAMIFLEELLNVSGLDKNFIRFVPGNHDINKKYVDKVVHKYLRGSKDIDEIGEVFKSKEQVGNLIKKFDNYNRFIKNNFQNHPQISVDQLHYKNNISINGNSIGLIGLTSPLTGYDADKGKLILYENETHKVFDNLNYDCVIAMSHHPISWFTPYEERYIKSLLARYSDIFLSGHLHEADLSTIISPSGQYHAFQAAASYDGRDKKNIYNIIKLNLYNHQGSVILRNYSDKEQGFWKIDNETYQNAPSGCYSWKLEKKDSTYSDSPSTNDQKYFDLDDLIGRDNAKNQSLEKFKNSLNNYFTHYGFSYIHRWQSQLESVLNRLFKLSSSEFRPVNADDAYNIYISSLSWLMLSLLNYSECILNPHLGRHNVEGDAAILDTNKDSVSLILKNCEDMISQIHNNVNGIDLPKFDKLTLFSSLVGFISEILIAFDNNSINYYRTNIGNRDEMKYKINIDEKSSLIHDINIDHNHQKITIYVTCSSPTIHNILLINKSHLQKNLEIYEEYLDKNGFKLPFTRIELDIIKVGYELIDIKYELEAENILKLLMGEELYEEKSVFVRELIQNSIDACMLRRLLSNEESYYPEIQIIYNARKGEFIIKDNGTGMSLYQIRKFFSKIGKSYYRSSDLKQELIKSGKDFQPISKFGIGFLSVFLVSKGVRIITSSYADNDAYTINIPGMFEHFYIQKTSTKDIGTTVILDLKRDFIKYFNLRSTIIKYILTSPVQISILDNDFSYNILANAKLSTNNLMPTNDLSDIRFLDIMPELETDKLTGKSLGNAIFSIPIPIPKRSADITYARVKEIFKKLPISIIKVGQHGIFIEFYNKLMTKNMKGDIEKIEFKVKFDYFTRIYGVIDLAPGTAELNISRSKVVWTEVEWENLRDKILIGLLKEISNTIITLSKGLEPTSLESIIKYLIFDLVSEGYAFSWYDRSNSIKRYNYCNDDRIRFTMADLYLRYINLNYIYNGGEGIDTFEHIINKFNTNNVYICLKSLVSSDLFKPFVSNLKIGSLVLTVNDLREGALLFSGLGLFYDKISLCELDIKFLQKDIKYSLIKTGIDRFIPAYGAVTDFSDYNTDLAIIELPRNTPGVIRRVDGKTKMRSDVSEDQKPYILFNTRHWFISNLISLLPIADETIKSNIENIFNLVDRYIIGEKTTKVRQVGIEEINKKLRELYLYLDKKNLKGDLMKEFLIEKDIGLRRGK